MINTIFGFWTSSAVDSDSLQEKNNPENSTKRKIKFRMLIELSDEVRGKGLGLKVGGPWEYVKIKGFSYNS
jgi:hypothetical protein